MFVNGHFSKQLSRTEALPKGVRAGSLAEALAGDGNTLERHLGRYAKDYREHAFVALNTAFLEDGAFVEIPKGVVLDKPILLLYVSLPGETAHRLLSAQPDYCRPRKPGQHH